MLKQLMLQRKIDAVNKSLEELRNKEELFKTRTEELEATITEAETDEEIEVVEKEVEKLEKEKDEVEEKKKKLEDELKQLESELEELNRKAPKNKEGKRHMPKRDETREAINEFIRSKGSVQKRDEFTSVEGGALIPEELLPATKEKVDELDLSKYIRTVKVNRGSGKYPVISKSGGRFVSVAELEKNPELATPTFTEVNYDIETYRGYIPISQEAIDDADYDIIGLISEDIRDQELNTKNEQIAAAFKTATSKAVTGLDGIIAMFNKDFKQVYNVKAYVSASLFNELDLLKDNNGRYLLEDDITVASGKRIKGKEVIVLDDTVIGTKEGDLVGFFGDAYEFVTLFDRKQSSVKWVDHNIYGQLLAGFVRFDIQKVDDVAGLYVTYTSETDSGV
ncbi:MAG: phage major capsid protein [Clostridiaceae bacterium]|nr:phage major capsid protein [Clostridiaceae bacterium]